MDTPIMVDRPLAGNNVGRRLMLTKLVPTPDARRLRVLGAALRIDDGFRWRAWNVDGETRRQQQGSLFSSHGLWANQALCIARFLALSGMDRAGCACGLWHACNNEGGWCEAVS
ncbi:hypothetical protein E4U43_001437 [Claviceps pusilla]|uniref:Uncharacterized protein n=1 Tax=Claviceps pusilla TaxID=123648 RepID=A0A9P7SZ94_9HYPO|nr:hypothetical protein E4U43_001437 [Claviceps pusilla]